MASRKTNTTNEIVKMLSNSAKELLDTATQSSVSFSPTVQKVPNTHMRPDLGCFVQFDGDFSGLVIMNFSGQAAVEIYRKYMISIGVPENELAQSHTNDEVGDGIGELVNQIIGKLRRELEKSFGVIVNHNQPKVVAISKSLVISIATGISRPLCRRISFKTEEKHAFYIELSVEPTEFIPLFDRDSEEVFDPEALLASMDMGK